MAVKEQVEAGVPKGTLRAISAVWLSKYLDYINALAKLETDSARMVSLTFLAQIFSDQFIF